jgi:hypothetical protein
MRRRYILIGAIVVLSVFLAGYKYRAKHVQTKLLLLEARLERTHSEKTEIVSKVRFVATSHIATSVFLPCSEKYGIGISFVPIAEGKDDILFSWAAYTERFWAEDILGTAEDWGEKYAEMGCTVSRSAWHGKIGKDYVFTRGGRGLNNVDVDYRVIVKCERIVDYEELRHVSSSMFYLGEEKLHRFNVAIPQLMSAGVELNIERSTKDR